MPDELEQRFRRDAVAAQEQAAESARVARDWFDCGAYCKDQTQAWQGRSRAVSLANHPKP